MTQSDLHSTRIPLAAMCRRDGGVCVCVCKSRHREGSEEMAAIIEVTVDGGLNQIVTVKVGRSGQIDSGSILTV